MCDGLQFECHADIVYLFKVDYRQFECCTDTVCVVCDMTV